jgi:hypothetical protein
LSFIASATPTAWGWRLLTGTQSEIPSRSGKVAAPLVAAPVEQYIDGTYAAPELGRLVPIGGEEHIIGVHRTGDADADRFLAQARRIGPKPARALQGDGLSVERPRQHHGAVQR